MIWASDAENMKDDKIAKHSKDFNWTFRKKDPKSRAMGQMELRVSQFIVRHWASNYDVTCTGLRERSVKRTCGQDNLLHSRYLYTRMISTGKFRPCVNPKWKFWNRVLSYLHHPRILVGFELFGILSYVDFL